jgi:Flp pilus assembly protein TadD
VVASERLRHLGLALADVESGGSALAEPACRLLLGSDPEDVEALLLLGLAIGLRGEAQTAAVILNRVAALREQHAHPCRDLATLLVRFGKASLIAPQFRACLEQTPHDRRLVYAFAEFLRRTGAPEQAVVMLDPVVRQHPDDAQAQDQRGLALAEAGRFAEAAESFRHAITLDPGPAAFWANLGMMLKVEGRFDEALAAYAEALARDPGNHRIRVNRAVACLHAGRFAEAWRDEA